MNFYFTNNSTKLEPNSHPSAYTVATLCMVKNTEAHMPLNLPHLQPT